MSISFKGYSSEVATFEKGTATVNYPVKIAGNGTVGNAVAGDDFIGVCVNIRGDYAGVQTNGYVEVAYTSSKPSLNYATLVADGNGGVKTSTTATNKSYKVIKVDETNKIVGFIL